MSRKGHKHTNVLGFPVPKISEKARKEILKARMERYDPADDTSILDNCDETYKTVPKCSTGGH